MIYAMFAMFLLTFIVGVITVTTRAYSINKRLVSLKAFRLMDKDGMPETVLKATRNFNHLFEVPVLFYIACLTLIFQGIQEPLATILTWVFVISRYVHSYIHLTYNNVVHRLIVFLGGFLSVLALWVLLMVELS